MNWIGYVTYLSIMGATAVAFGYPTIANVLWAIANPILVWHNYKRGEIEQARMFCIFTVLAFVGVGRYLFLQWE